VRLALLALPVAASVPLFREESKTYGGIITGTMCSGERSNGAGVSPRRS
jgi:hypothetical protein